MKKLIAIVNIVSWGGFWAFGYLAFTAGSEREGQLVTALILAALGAGAGVFAWLWLVRHSEATGYAKRTRVLDPAAREAAQAEHGQHEIP